MRLDDITKPFLESNLTIDEFAEKINISITNVRLLIRNDICLLTHKLDIYIPYRITINNIINDRSQILEYINQYLIMELNEIKSKIQIEDKEREELNSRLINETMYLSNSQIEKLIRSIQKIRPLR